MSFALLAPSASELVGGLPLRLGIVIGLLVLVILLTAAVAWLCWQRPDIVVRVLLYLPAHVLYKIRVFGQPNIPEKGPALFVCNHVSFIDAFLVFLAQKRLVRFIIWAPYTRLPGLGFLLRLARVIPIDGSAGPRAVIRSLQAASAALNNGEVVCIFAEGGITRTGFLLPFNRGFEHILKRSPAPIIPVCLDHVWGSIFSYQGGRFLWKWPQTFPFSRYPVSIAFGRPLPPTTPAVQVRQAIQKLSADCAIARIEERRPVHRQFVHLAARHPFRKCLIDPTNNGKVYRYGEVLAGACILARLLRPLLGDDAMVGLWLPPSPGGAVANLTLALLGKTAVNLNYTSSAETIRSAIRQCNLRHVISSRVVVSKLPLDPGPDVQLIYLEDFRPQVSRIRRLWAFLTVVLLPAYVMEYWFLGLGRHQLDDLATVIFSSGSTGDPKGVMLTHRNLATNAESMIQAIDPRPSDRLLGILPLFHSFGYTVTLWVPLQVAFLLFHADPRQAKEIGELCRKYGCTIFLTTPTLLRFCLKRCEPEDFKTVRILMVGAEKLSPMLAQEFKAKFGVLPLEGYGCTELSPVAAANVPDWEEAGVHQIGNKPGTIGQPVPGVAAAIAHPETLEPLPPNREGMLMIYGGNVMKGYLGRPEATREVIRDGWYITGDIAKYDDEGFITITDRLARFSKIGGEMVPHQKIEDELHRILGTNERICVVTSVPDERRGERLVVLHTPLNGVNLHHLVERLTEQGLPNLWIPSERDFKQIPEMPVLGSGKVDLKRVKELAQELAR